MQPACGHGETGTARPRGPLPRANPLPDNRNRRGNIIGIPMFMRHRRPAAGCRRLGIRRRLRGGKQAYPKGNHMNSIIYLVGLVVVVLAILSFLGLR